MGKVTLVDAGPLVALLLRSESRHKECVQTLDALEGTLATVWPAITEASHLLRADSRARDALLEWVELDSVRALPILESDVMRVRELLRKYEDLPMDLADACLVRLAEREGIDTVFTLDRRDFEVYRPRGIGRFKIVP